MFDVVILGAGPAGVTAAIYCARYRLKTLLISKDIGGYVRNAVDIENYPGFAGGPGFDLAKLFKDNIKNNDIEHKRATVTEIEKLNDVDQAANQPMDAVSAGFRIKTNKGEFESRFVIYALGTEKRVLPVPGNDLIGIYHCATCDAPMMQDKEVVVIGGNDSGTSSAYLISQYAKKVTIIEILDKLPSEPFWLDKIKVNPKIEVVTADSVKEIKGEQRVESVLLKSGKDIKAEGLFIEIGSLPNIKIAEKLGAEMDKHNCIVVGSDQQTTVEGLYAAGDLTNGSNYLRQIVSAQCEGAVAAQSVYKKILE